METPKYIFDSSIFITLQRRYPPDVYESLWEIIDKLIKEGIVVSSEEVFDEIKIGNDVLVEWAKKNKYAFIQSDEKIQNTVKQILKNNEKLVLGSKKTNGADPFVVALAIINSCKVVTEETKNGEDNPPKIPNVCNSYGVKYLSFVDFLRELQIKI